MWNLWNKFFLETRLLNVIRVSDKNCFQLGSDWSHTMLDNEGLWATEETESSKRKHLPLLHYIAMTDVSSLELSYEGLWAAEETGSSQSKHLPLLHYMAVTGGRIDPWGQVRSTWFDREVKFYLNRSFQVDLTP